MFRIQQHRFIDLARPVHRRSGDDSGLDRRSFLGAASALAAITAMAPQAFARNFEPGAEPVRYPDPDVVVLDKSFTATLGNTAITRLHTGTLWAEGPAWNGAGRFLVWSDIPNNEQLRWIEEDGHVSRYFRYPSGNSNGNTFDWEGREIACEHNNRRVVRYEYDGSVTELAGPATGLELNAPNDAVVRKDDHTIWFTDPGYGQLMNYEGTRAKTTKTGSVQPFVKEAIYVIDPKDGSVKKVADEPLKPNGLCFSPDYRTLYVADTGKSHYPDVQKNIVWAYGVDGNKLVKAREFVDMEMDGKSGFADGITTDEDGNLWAAAGWVGDGYDGVHIFSPAGQRIGQIRLPEICSNVAFGGTEMNRLFMTASQSLYALYVETTGAHMLGA
jgi:gluconolactonase